MREYKAPGGKRKLWYEPSEIDQIMVDELRRACLLSDAESNNALRHELAEAKAEIERLDDQNRELAVELKEWDTVREEVSRLIEATADYAESNNALRDELAEAEAEIDRTRLRLGQLQASRAVLIQYLAKLSREGSEEPKRVLKRADEASHPAGEGE